MYVLVWDLFQMCLEMFLVDMLLNKIFVLIS